jgi:HTH-type transcriptional regulator/antitoxin HigA
LEALGMTQAELAARADLSLKHVNQIVLGIAPLTPETALSFEKVTGVSSKLWNQLEANYRDQLARVEDKESLSTDAEWLQELPINELRRRGVLSSTTDKSTLLQEVCRFFGVANRESWERIWRQPLASFKRSPGSDTAAVATWLRLGELKAQNIECEPFDASTFRAALRDIRSMTRSTPAEFEPRLKGLCSKSGVALVFLPEIKGVKCWGAAQFLQPTKALIQLSLRYKKDDHLWFSFFHEAGHILLHSKKATFVSTDLSRDDAEEEDEANAFAESFLIPKQYDARLRQLTFGEIPAFAEELGIAPGIVVGRLQKEGLLNWNQGHGLKRTFRFIEESE